MGTHSDESGVMVSAGENWSHAVRNNIDTINRSSSVTSLTLDELNEKQAILHLPIVAFLALLMLMSIAGNICVIYVYRTRFRKTSGNFFIMVLAMIDFATSCVCIPWEIFRLSSPYRYQSSSFLCKPLRLVQSFLYLSAAIILVCVAFSRYYRIVKPLHCYSSGQAQSLTIVAMVMTLSLVWPQLLLSGKRTVNLDNGVSGHQCDITDQLTDTIYSFLYHGIFYGVFMLCFVVILLFYFRILSVVCCLGRGHLRAHGVNRERHSPRSSTSNVSERSFGSSVTLSVTSRSQRSGVGPMVSNDRCSKLLRRVGRTSSMLALVTFVFLLGYLPSLIAHLLHFCDLGFQRPLTYDQQILYELCLRSHFLSSAANPLIYSILNSRFRQESMVALRSILLRLPLWIQTRVKGHHELRQ